MRITLNDKPTDLPAGTTVALLLAQLGLDSTRVAVVIGADIVPRAEYSTRGISEGDSVELVSFVGGG